MTEKQAMEIIKARPFQLWADKDPMTIPCHETSDAERLCKHPVVSVKMITYNHEPYIRQAIEGVMMQKTDFEFELVIGEDCSTDKTREICFEYQKKYPDKIRVLWSEENLCQHPHPAGDNSRRTVAHCRGEFVAFCEGDDYWTDPTKLQRQVDVMRRYPDVSFCVHRFVELINGVFSHPMKKEHLARMATYLAASPDTDGFKFSRDAPHDLGYHTATVMYRKTLFDQDFYDRAKFHCDMVMFHAALRKGEGYFINREMSVYRIGEQSSFASLTKRSRYEFMLRHRWAIYDADPCPQTEKDYRRAIRAFRHLEFPRNVLLPLRRKMTAFLRHILHLDSACGALQSATK